MSSHDPLGSRLKSFKCVSSHVIRMSHMCGSPWSSPTSLSTSTCPSPSSSTPLSWCTLRCTPTSTTWTPWKITLDNSRPQSPKRQLQVSKQSSIRSRGTGSSHSMDPGVSVQKQNFKRNPEKVAKVPGTREETKSHLHWQFFGIRQSLWRFFMESLHVYTTPIGDQWYCRKSSAQSKGRHFCCIVAIGSDWKLVGRFHECYTHLRNVTDLLFDGKTPHERRFGQPFKGPTIPFGSLVENHFIIAKDQSWMHQFGKKVLLGLFLGNALYAGRIWKGDVLIADVEELETMDASEI